jgi:hypothetical protein
MKRIAVVVLALLLVAGDAAAATERRIRSLNIGAQAVMTLVSGLLQRKVQSFADAARCLGTGAAAGYGSFESKILVRNGHVQQGWLLANASSSLSENAAAGKHPLAQIGYTVGPLRLRVSIPRLDRGADAYSYLDLSTSETASLIYAFNGNGKVHFRSGMIVFEKRTPYPRSGHARGFDGYTWGIYPGVWRDTRAPDEILHHETIHAIQSLQADAVEPSFEMLTVHPSATSTRRLIRFDHLKLGIVGFGNGLAVGRDPYVERWTEIEAYRLAQGIAPIP